jgi:hypothetical protein
MLRLESLNLKEICACKTPPQIGVKYVAGSVELHEISLWATEEQITRENGIQIHAAAWRVGGQFRSLLSRD